MAIHCPRAMRRSEFSSIELCHSTLDAFVLAMIFMTFKVDQGLHFQMILVLGQ